MLSSIDPAGDAVDVDLTRSCGQLLQFVVGERDGLLDLTETLKSQVARSTFGTLP